MKTAKVVIGAGFGDEGKGLMTDYYAAQFPNCVVVRFNGGAQAGHTVVTPDGDRHVFSHYGSGTLVGAATFLSSHFLVNPSVWDIESEKLRAYVPKLSIDPNALVTTYFDMVINQIRDFFLKHGSCGLGINETVVRSQQEDLVLRAKDLLDMNLFKEKLDHIQSVWPSKRLAELGIEMTSPMADVLSDIKAMEKYMASAMKMAENVKIESISSATESRDVVFEGAQGLLLDEDHAFFPHVTRSKTGLTNVVTLAHEADITELDVTYVIRAYMSRHGNGPFPTMNPDLTYEDTTNVENYFQGAIRFGALDLDLVGAAIRNDLDAAKIKVNPRLVITHIDQMDNKFPVHYRGLDTGPEGLTLSELVAFAGLATNIKKFGVSNGPTRNHVSFLE